MKQITKETKQIIKNVAYYVPKNVIHNKDILEYYKNNHDKDVTGLLNATGRKERRISDEYETIISMAINSTRDVLKRSNLKAEDIDMIIFSSGTPEYIQPCNAIKLHSALGCKKDIMVYDLNASCVGMLVALSQAVNTMKANKRMKYAIVVGAEQFLTYTDESKVIPRSVFGESACTVLLENIETAEERGLLDFSYHTNSKYNSYIQFPSRGMKNAILDENATKLDRMIDWLQFGLGATHGSASKLINELLERNGIEKGKIKKYFFSQFTKKGNDMVANELEEDICKFKYVGDKFGYTGTTSPFIALAESLQDGEVKEGDYVLFWSVGSGFTCHTSLMKL